jgi:hypothetical protein
MCSSKKSSCEKLRMDGVGQEMYMIVFKKSDGCCYNRY